MTVEENLKLGGFLQEKGQTEGTGGYGTGVFVFSKA